MVRVALFSLILLLLPQMTFARGSEHYVPVTKESGELFGMEIEIAGPESLGRILNFFEVGNETTSAHLAKRFLTEEDLDRYLNPANLEALPAELKAQLTHGLKLESGLHVETKAIIVPSLKAPAGPKSGIILLNSELSRGSAVESPKIILGPTFGRTLNANEAAAAKPKELLGVESARRSQTWDTILARWKKLPDSERRKVYDLNQLPSDLKGAWVLTKKLPIGSFTLRKDAPEKVKSLFSRLNWNFEEVGGIELRHHKPVSSVDLFHADRELLSDIAGIRKYIDDPSLIAPNSKKFSYHWHGSRHGSAVREIVAAEKKIRLVNMAIIGRADSTLGDSLYGHDGILGTIKEVNTHHLESRMHAESPRAEFARLHSWMQLSAEDVKVAGDEELNARSMVLQNQIDSQLAKNAAEVNGKYDLGRRIVALGVADREGLSKLKSQAALKTFVADSPVFREILKLSNPEEAIKICENFGTAASLKENYQRIVKKVITSPNEQDFTAFNVLLKKKGVSDLEVETLQGTELPHVLRNLDLIEVKPKALAAVLARTEGTGEAGLELWEISKYRSTHDAKQISEVLAELERLAGPKKADLIVAVKKRVQAALMNDNRWALFHVKEIDELLIAGGPLADAEFQTKFFAKAYEQFKYYPDRFGIEDTYVLIDRAGPAEAELLKGLVGKPYFAERSILKLIAGGHAVSFKNLKDIQELKIYREKINKAIQLRLSANPHDAYASELAQLSKHLSDSRVSAVVPVARPEVKVEIAAPSCITAFTRFRDFFRRRPR